MNSTDINKADRILRNCFRQMGSQSLLDMKYTRFMRVREDLYSALKLMEHSEVHEIKLNEKNDPDNIIDIFDEYYPEWRELRRSRVNKVPRQMIQYFLASRTSLTLKEIGKRTGGYDHTTVIHSKQIVNDMLETDVYEYVRIYNRISELLK